jgi:hypothetical protein
MPRPGQVTEGRAHFRAYFERSGPDRRPEPGQQLAGSYRQGPHRGLQNTRLQPAPAGMGSSHHGAGPVAQQHWQAIGGHDGAGDPGPGSPTGICGRRGALPTGLHYLHYLHYLHSVALL